MFGIHILSVYLMSVALLMLLVVVLIWQKQRSGKTVALWASAAIIGILLGTVAPMSIANLLGYSVDVTPKVLAEMAAAGGGSQPPAYPGGEMASMPGMEGMGGMGGMGGDMGGMGAMGGMGGPPAPQPKRDLATLVRKIELLTGDVAITLTGDQAAALCASLADIETPENMTDDDAQAKHEAILALLDDSQKARLEAIGLPRRRPSGSGPGGPAAGGPGAPGGEKPPAEANPFREEANAAAVATLRQRFAGRVPPAEPPAKQ